MSDQNEEKPFLDGVSRRSFLGVGSAALATVAMAGLTAHAQQREDTTKAEGDHSSSDPGPENRVLLAQNPNSNMPPPTDHGDIGPIWYSFDLARKRVEEGGWTHQVTERELPPSKDLVGVNMRLTSGSFRELHWHTANEWAYMEYGTARVTVLNPDGTMFIDDVGPGDLWFFPAGYPHSIQGLGKDGCQFLLVFDEGNFSEDGTFLLSEFVAHVPPDILTKNSSVIERYREAPEGTAVHLPGRAAPIPGRRQGRNWRKPRPGTSAVHLQDGIDGAHIHKRRR